MSEPKGQPKPPSNQPGFFDRFGFTPSNSASPAVPTDAAPSTPPPQPQSLEAIEAAYLNRLSPGNKDYERNRLTNLTSEARDRTTPGLANLSDQEIVDANDRIMLARSNLLPPPPPVNPVPAGAGAGAADQNTGAGDGSSPLPVSTAPAKTKTFSLKVFVTSDKKTKVQVLNRVTDTDEEVPEGTVELKTGFTGIDSKALTDIKGELGLNGPVAAAPVGSGSVASSGSFMSRLNPFKRGGSKKKRRKSTKRRGKTARR